MILTGTTLLAGVVGWPVAHSRSPRLHGHWLQRYGIDGAYVPLPVRAPDLAAALQGLRLAGFRGANVTVPHKVAAFAACDQVSEFARQAGAVNTLVFDDGRVLGSNTDGAGFLRSLADQDVDPVAGPALVLGAGGAARAIAAALLAAGAPVVLCARRAEMAAALARLLPGSTVLPWGHRADALGGIALLVNATSCGMAGQPALDIRLDRAGDLVVADIVTTPRQTPLLAEAARRGLRTVEGIGMLLHQAVPGFAAWFGVEPVVDGAVRDFVLAG